MQLTAQPSGLSSHTLTNRSSRHRLGRVPGSFEDDDRLTTHSSVEDMSRHAEANATVDRGDSPSLPPLPGDDSSFIYSRSDGEPSRVGDDLDRNREQEMQRKLMDFESSFLPALSPGREQPGARSGADSVRHTARRPTPASARTERSIEQTERHDVACDSPPTPPESYRTPAPPSTPPSKGKPAGRLSLQVNGHDLSSLESMSSSPTAAAAARTVARVISMTSVSGYETADDGGSEVLRRLAHDLDSGEQETPRTGVRVLDSTAGGSPGSATPTQRPSTTAMDVQQSADEAAVNARNGSDPSNRRPHALSVRHASHLSSASSITTTSMVSQESGSDATLGADYALQTGGAAPENGSVGTSRMQLSRCTSLGSIASGITGVEDSTGSWDRGRTVGGTSAATASVIGLRERAMMALEEERRDSERHQSSLTNNQIERDEPVSSEQTPKPTGRKLVTPTDTVISQHVREVRVPASVAREYMESNEAPSPEKKSGVRPSVSGRSKGLSLKEQSSTIDRLQKENFDLKLKVHYLDKALKERSDEGVKKMISENVELKVALATMEKQNRTLRRRLADLEEELDDKDGSPAETPRASSASEDGAAAPWPGQDVVREMEEEIIYLREHVETSRVEVEQLRGEAVARDAENRRMGELVKVMGEKSGSSFDMGVREEMDMWKDLYEAEVARRERADQDTRKLQEEIWRLKDDISVAGTNGYTRNASRLRQDSRLSVPVSRSSESERTLDRNGTLSGASSTLVEQLRHENEELRREVSAQTSMLTSRNREKERLYQEIEDLKLGQMRGDMHSVAGDSTYERSASGIYGRSVSRASRVTRVTGLSDAEREDLEQKNGQLRDTISELKLKSQELERRLEECLDELEQIDATKADRDKMHEEEMEMATRDLQTMQSERDEALMQREELETDFESLKREAQHEITNLETDLEQRLEEIQQLEREVNNRHESFNALQAEMRSMSEIVVRLEDDQKANTRKVMQLQRELGDAHKELEILEKNLREANAKIERFTVQQESSKGEIAFLREEQDADKMKIGDLESALKRATDGVQEGKERIKELETRLADERHQREVVVTKEKQEVQRIVNDLNRELSNSKDEARKLRKNLTSREVEATEWKERLTELENNLRAALGDLSGTRSSLLKSVTKLQKELEATVAELEATKSSLAEKERILRHRDALLESAGLESQKLSETLEKERQARKADKHHFEQVEKSSRQTARTAAQHEARVHELEHARQSDRKKLAAVETQYKDQLMERNNLLLALWNRLSTMCGTDWALKHSQVGGKLPSIEVVSSMLPGFSKNLLLAVRTIEGLVGSFKIRIRNIEKDLWREYQKLEQNVDVRLKKLDRLEGVVYGDGTASTGSSTELVKLRSENNVLKAELNVLQKEASPVRPSLNGRRYPSGGMPTGEMHPATLASMTRHYSTSAVETLGRYEAGSASSQPSVAGDPSEQRWIYRLRELEKRLKAEREARLLDRNGARKRLEEGRAQYDELRQELERQRVRNNGE